MAAPQHKAVNNPNALPVYVQIAELLIREIEAARLLDGERLPPEREMAGQMKVSVGTLRKALAEVEKRGMLERVQGSGNYVRAGGKGDSVYAMFRLELPEGGGLPRADVLSVDVIEKPDDLPEFGRSDQGSRVRRMRYLNDTLIAVEEIWLDRSSGVIEADLLSDSLYRYYQRQLGFWITRIEDRVRIAPLPDWTPHRFTKPAGQITGFIERFSWSDQSEPVEYSRTWFDPDAAVYVQRLK
jgi:GntR family transcriptional regulator